MNALMISCKKAGELIEKKAVDSLSIGELFQLKSHLLLCDVCSRYEKFSNFIGKYMQQSKVKASDNKIVKLPEQVKQEILKKTNESSS